MSFHEALGNALKHANATRIDVTLTPEAPGFLTVCITDNGTGYEPPQVLARPVGLGLSMIAERAESIGGRAEILRVCTKTNLLIVVTDLPGIADHHREQARSYA